MSEEEVDIEALQAQIELSASVSFDVVASWMKPIPPRSTPSVSETISKEMEEFARRPQRLGLGATVSKSTAMTTQETARLKRKLIDRKPGGDGERASASTATSRIENKAENDIEDEEDSRSAAIAKKADESRSFAVGKTNADMRIPPATTRSTDGNGKRSVKSFSENNPSTLTNGSNSNPFVSPRTPLRSPEAKPQGLTPPKSTQESGNSKKRRKKRLKEERIAREWEMEWTGFGDAFKDLIQSVATNAEQQDELMAVDSSSISVVQESSTISSPSSTGANPSKPMSALSLDGLLPVVQSGTSETPNSSTKRKRRRRRKKKNSG